jgi:hypothetical protein
MTLDEIINLMMAIEDGQENQRVGFHLHQSLRQATTQTWPTNASYPPRFSGFLQALRDAEVPE